MKIITMSTSSPKKLYGGAYKRYMELINGFLSKGWEVNHISPKGFSSIQHENLIHHSILSIPIFPSYLSLLIQGSIMAIIMGSKKDIDTIVTFSFFDALIGIIFKIFNKNTKLVYCDRGDTIKGFMIDFKKKYNNYYLNYIALYMLTKFEKFIYKRLDLVIFNSNVRKEEINEKIKLEREKVKTIYNNANPSWVIKKMDDAKVESRKIRDKWEGKNILCFIGNLFMEGRDLKTLIKAFKIVNETMPETILLIVGEGPDKHKLIEFRDSSGLNESILFEGWQENPFSYMLAADINIVTALHEGCSNTILEAIYCENVMLGSKIGGTFKLLKYDEILFQPKNYDEMSKKIINLLQNEDKLAKAKNLIKNRKNKFIFDWNGEMISAIADIAN